VDLSFASAPSDWSPDEHFLLYTDLQEGTMLHLWVMPMTGDRKPYRFLLAIQPTWKDNSPMATGRHILRRIRPMAGVRCGLPQVAEEVPDLDRH
jgi:hypothetical protein